ncbi:MAG: hypothetical protein HC838_17890, partial [Spirulinaceae cyanobacterium RM2_2_10]|nr:hypothetical protein [Spirulinaceae cyanobacterium RM2_2_10]
AGVSLINLLADPPQLRAAAEAIAHYVQHRATPPTTPGGEDRVNRPTALTMRALRQRPRRSSPHTVTQPTPSYAVFAPRCGGDRDGTPGRFCSLAGALGRSLRSPRRRRGVPHGSGCTCLTRDTNRY